MNSLSLFVILLVLICNFHVNKAAPQFPQRKYTNDGNEPPQPYDFQYKVESSQTNTFFGQNESGDVQGNVLGKYFVLLPDGRLMNVEYKVEGESGFVPRITFSPQNAPITSAPRLG